MSFQKLLLLCIFFISISAHSQTRVITSSLLPKKEIDSIYLIPKKNLNAAGLTFGTNLGVWAFDRYVSERYYAHINYSTIKKNIRTGFVWDNDMFLTNLFLHPYHGGLYFSAARSNGMHFWESVPFAVGGSLMWEFCMENKPASINDFLATSIGGICLGEVTFRISDRMIDDQTVGSNRILREALVFLISPARELNRLISGEAWHRRNTRGRAIPSTPIVFYSTIGDRFIAENLKEKLEYSDMICMDLGLNYGDSYDMENDRPYDFFLLRMEGNLFSKQPTISRVSALGLLQSQKINLQRSNLQMVLGLFQHFNYYQSNADTNYVSLNPYKISEAASVGPGLLFRAKLKNHFTFSASTFLSAIFLGGSQTDHFKIENRDYNMGSGFSTKLNLELQYNRKLSILLNSEDYRIFSWVGVEPSILNDGGSSVQGDKGNASLSVAKLSLRYMINNHILIGSETGFFYRRSLYKYYPDVEHSVRENKICVGYTF